MIKMFEEFGPTPNVLALPPHETEIPADTPEPESRKMIITLRELHEMEHHDVIDTAARIRAIMESGSYLKVREMKSNIWLLNQNEPLIIFGVTKGRKVTIGHNFDVQIDEDSIVICAKSDDSFLALSVKDRYEFTFIRPNIVISKHDPYGEEDWEEEDDG